MRNVDVSECCYLINYDPPKGQGTWCGAIHKGACKVYSADCKYNENCYYKQLKRLEQENAELKAENEQLKEEILKWQKAYSRQYQINENKGYNKKEEQYHQTLQEIKTIAESEYYAVEPDARYIIDKILGLITKAEEY